MKDKISELTTKGIILRIIRKVNLLDAVFQEIMSRMVASQNWREKLNKFYNKLNYDEKDIFHSIFYRTFEGKKNTLEGFWIIQFLNSQIKLPFRKESSWLDWVNAVSIVGHDVDVKQTYEMLLESRYRPSVFFDVGANYGTHSLLFLAQGVTTISFEPNPICKEQFNQFCQLNNFSAQMKTVAVGDRNGTVDLWFPENATWLGTIVETTKNSLQELNLEKLQVPLISLDSYTIKSGLYPDLIKIDTEGNEISVIKGATETIKTAKPIIIFECNELNNKTDLWNAFDILDYTICTLPSLPKKQISPLNLKEFISKNNSNFIALTKNHSILSETI